LGSLVSRFPRCSPSAAISLRCFALSPDKTFLFHRLYGSKLVGSLAAKRRVASHE